MRFCLLMIKLDLRLKKIKKNKVQFFMTIKQVLTIFSHIILIIFINLIHFFIVIKFILKVPK